MTEAIHAVVRGDLDVAKILLRDYHKRNRGGVVIGKAVHKSPKSLMHMPGGDGSPTAENLFGVTQYLQKNAGVRFKVVTDDLTAGKTRVR